MKIIATTSFKHGRAQFAAGKGYEVPDKLAGYFEFTGWAREATAEDAGPFEAIAPAMFTSDALDIQNVAKAAASKAGG